MIKLEYCKCGSIKELGVCSNRRCPELNNKYCKWIVDGVEVLFKEPVTLAEAEAAYRAKSPIIISRKNGHKMVVDQ